MVIFYGNNIPFFFLFLLDTREYGKEEFIECF